MWSGANCVYLSSLELSASPTYGVRYMAYNNIHIVVSILPVGCASACYERVRTPAHAHAVAECAAPQVITANTFG